MSEVDTDSVSRKIRDDSYFREARQWYALLFHMPIIERSLYLVIIAVAFIICWTSINSFLSILPLSPPIPFSVFSYDSFEEIPSIRRLRTSPTEDRNMAVMRYFLTDYVERRETYRFDQAMLERNFYNIRSHSTPEVFQQYRDWLDAANPSSPFNLFQNHTVRRIEVASIRYNLATTPQRARVYFVETREREGSLPKIIRWVADVEYTYVPFTVRQDIEEPSLTNYFGIALDVYYHPEKYTEKKPFTITPMTFKVSDYRVTPYTLD